MAEFTSFTWSFIPTDDLQVSQGDFPGGAEQHPFIRVWHADTGIVVVFCDHLQEVVARLGDLTDVAGDADFEGTVQQTITDELNGSGQDTDKLEWQVGTYQEGKSYI